MMISIRKYLKKAFKNEKGAFLALSAGAMGSVLLATVLAIDVGYIFVVQTELQNAADSAALAGVSSTPLNAANATQAAQAYGQTHIAGSENVQIRQEMIDVGNFDFKNRAFTAGATPFNAVRVTAERNPASNAGSLGLLFARVLGVRDTVDLARVAIAAVDQGVVGVPGSGHLIPYTVLKDLVDVDGDGHFDIGRTLDIHPAKNDAPGNFGYLDLDGDNNSTNITREQIINGWDQDFVIPEAGFTDIYGDTGILGNAPIDEFDAIVGKTVYLPVHVSVTSQGAGGNYRVVSIVPIKVRSVKLTGAPDKRSVIVEVVKSSSSNLIVREGGSENNAIEKLRLVQ